MGNHSWTSSSLTGKGHLGGHCSPCPISTWGHYGGVQEDQDTLGNQHLLSS